MGAVVTGKRDLSDGSVAVDFVVNAKEVSSTLNDCYEQLALRAGFGSAVDVSLLEKRYGSDGLSRLTNGYLMDKYGFFALEYLGGAYATDPECSCEKNCSPDEDFFFTARVFNLPSGELSSLEPVSVDAKNVSDKQIDEKIKEISRMHARRKDVSGCRPVAMGDVVELDVCISVHGVSVPGYTRKGSLLEVCYESMPQGFIDNVVGMQVGESKEFDFSAPLADCLGNEEQEVCHAEVLVFGQYELEEPCINDAWVQRYLPGISNVCELRLAIAEAIRRNSRGDASSDFDAAIDDALIERLSVDLPEGLVDMAQRNAIGEARRQIALRGQTLKQHLLQTGDDMHTWSDRVRVRVTRELKQAAALDALFVGLDLTLSEEDINDTISCFAQRQEAEVKRELSVAGKMHLVENAARRRKAHDWLVATARVNC